MGKCFVTTLKGVTANGNLPILGKIRINLTGEDNPVNGAAGNIKICGSYSTWKGEGTCNITNLENNSSAQAEKTAKGVFLIDDKYNVSEIQTNYGYGANVEFSDLNRFCSKLLKLNIGNTKQTGDLSEIAELSKLEELDISYSMVSGHFNVLKCIGNLKKFACIKNKNVILSTNDFALATNIEIISCRESMITGNTNIFANFNKLKQLSVFGTAVTGDLSVLANLPKLTTFSCYALSTWSSDSLRNSSYPRITGVLGFTDTTSTDNFLKNMAKCTDEGVVNKTIYFQNSHRTSASDAAVSTLQAAGYTLENLIKN